MDCTVSHFINPFQKMGDQDDYILWAGNLEDKVTEELLYELFLQAGPLDYVKKPKEKNFAFICYKHKDSVKYAMKLFEGKFQNIHNS